MKSNLLPFLQVALTSGEWEVLGRNLWVDKEQQLVYFLGLRETPLEKHLYVVSLQRPEHIRQLTESGYSYVVEFDDVSVWFIANCIHNLCFFCLPVLSINVANLLQHSTFALVQSYAFSANLSKWWRKWYPTIIDGLFA